MTFTKLFFIRPSFTVFDVPVSLMQAQMLPITLLNVFLSCLFFRRWQILCNSMFNCDFHFTHWILRFRPHFLHRWNHRALVMGTGNFNTASKEKASILLSGSLAPTVHSHDSRVWWLVWERISTLYFHSCVLWLLLIAEKMRSSTEHKER